MALVMLLLVATVNMLDKALFTVLADPIKREFSLNDTQTAMLASFSYAIFFAVAGIPLGIVADRRSRRNLIAICMTFWSAITMLSGLPAAMSSWCCCAAWLAPGNPVRGRRRFP